MSELTPSALYTMLAPRSVGVVGDTMVCVFALAWLTGIREVCNLLRLLALNGYLDLLLVLDVDRATNALLPNSRIDPLARSTDELILHRYHIVALATSSETILHLG